MMTQSPIKTKSWSERVKKSSGLISEVQSLVSNPVLEPTTFSPLLSNTPVEVSPAQATFWNGVLDTPAAVTTVDTNVVTKSEKKPYKKGDKKQFKKGDNKDSPYFTALMKAQTQYLNELVSDVTIPKLTKMDEDCMHINNYRKKHWLKEADDEIVVTEGEKQFTFGRKQFFENVNFHYRFREIVAKYAPNLWVWLNVVDDQLCLIFNKSR
jgi:hypothetical protein